MLDHPEDLMPLPEALSKDETLERMRRLLAIRTVNDLCDPEELGAGAV